MAEIVHDTLPCGIEYAVEPMPSRHVVCFQLRVLGGLCAEPPDRLGLAHLVEETLDKGTLRYDGRALSDAFDVIGAGRGSGTGRETTTFTCTVLPEHFERAVALHAEFLRNPTFPEEVFRTNVDLAKQELLTLEDDPQGLVDKRMSRRAFGPVLGRHPLGEAETLDRATRDDLITFWQRHFVPGRMLLAVAGAVEPRRVAGVFEEHFSGFAPPGADGRAGWPVEFSPGRTHFEKQLEQEQIGICWPAVDVTHTDFPTQQVMLGILSGGMSCRLFTEVREKLGLVYWVGAWQDTPRGAGMIFLGASTTPERCDRTYGALLREVDRLAEDIEPDELERAVTGIVAGYETRGDGTNAHCRELAADLFFFGRPLPTEEKIAKVQAVTIDRIRDYLSRHPRNELCVVTLGPRPLTAAAN